MPVEVIFLCDKASMLRDKSEGTLYKGLNSGIIIIIIIIIIIGLAAMLLVYPLLKDTDTSRCLTVLWTLQWG